MDLAAGQLPDEPRLHRAEQQVAALGTRTHAGHVVQDPLELCGREVGVDDQPGLLPDQVGQAAGLQLVAVLACAAALPDNGVVDRLAGVTVPDDGRLALVRDADGGDVLRRRADLVHGRQRHAELGRPDLVGVMLDPAGLGEILGELLLRDAAHLAPGVKKDAAVGRGARVQRHDIFLLCHRGFSFYSRKSIRVFIIQDVQILCAWQNRQIFHPIFGRAGVGRGRHGMPDGAEMPSYKLV